MQKLFYNVTGQTLTYDPIEGQASSVTSVQVFPVGTSDDGTAESATTGSASIDSVDTTFDAASGAGQSDPTLCNLAATTNIVVGRKYLATNATGEKEWIEVKEITSGASVNARHPLANAYTTSDTFEGCRLSISILDAWIQDSGNISDDTDPNPSYRVRWVYVVGGVTYVQDEYFDVVRYREDHDVLPQDIDRRSPGWINALPTEYREDQGRALIDEAYRLVTLDLHKVDVPEEMVRSREIMRALIIEKATMLADELSARRGGDPTGYEISRDSYNSLLDGMVRVVNRTPLATDASGASSSSVVAVSLWEK